MLPAAVVTISGAESAGAPSRTDRAAALFVWGLWAAMTAALLGYVGSFARDVPWWDDWDLVPVLSGREPVTAAWLWERHNEHRLLVPKLVHLALAAAAGGADFRTGAYLNALLLAGGTLVLILTARRLRGHTAVADAIFPLILLHWGQYENLIWSFQVQFIVATALFLVAVALLVTACPERLGWRGLLVGVCAIVLPFCGINGAVLAPALVLWLAWVARRHTRWLLLLALGAAVVLAGSLLDFSPAALHPPAPTVGAISSLLVLLMAAGPVGVVCGGAMVGTLMLLLTLTSAGLLARSCGTARLERLRGVGLLAAIGTVLALGVAVGWGRAGLHADNPGSITGVTRYITLMAPLPCFGALAAVMTRTRLVAYLLLAAAAVMLPANTHLGCEAARWRADVLDHLIADARRGIPPEQLSETYGPYVHAVDRDLLSQRMAMLREARLGPYRGLLQPKAFTIDAGEGPATSRDDARWTATLPKPSVRASTR